MKPVTKEDVKREIDKLPDSLIGRLYKFISSLKSSDSKKRPLPSFDFEGKYDEVDIRSKAYE